MLFIGESVVKYKEVNKSEHERYLFVGVTYQWICREVWTIWDGAHYHWVEQFGQSVLGG